MREQEAIMRGSGHITAREAADLAGVDHIGTIHRWATDGKLKYQRGGENKNAPWYIDVRSLRAFFASNTTILARIDAFIATNKDTLTLAKEDA